MNKPSLFRLKSLDSERYKCLWGKVRGSLAGTPAIVLNLRHGIDVHAEGYSPTKGVVKKLFVRKGIFVNGAQSSEVLLIIEEQ